jgi:hypothetical protein
MLMPKQCSQSPSHWLTYQDCNRSRFVIGISPSVRYFKSPPLPMSIDGGIGLLSSM